MRAPHNPLYFRQPSKGFQCHANTEAEQLVQTNPCSSSSTSHQHYHHQCSCKACHSPVWPTGSCNMLLPSAGAIGGKVLLWGAWEICSATEVRLPNFQRMLPARLNCCVEWPHCVVGIQRPRPDCWESSRVGLHCFQVNWILLFHSSFAPTDRPHGCTHTETLSR